MKIQKMLSLLLGVVLLMGMATPAAALSDDMLQTVATTQALTEESDGEAAAVQPEQGSTVTHLPFGRASIQ